MAIENWFLVEPAALGGVDFLLKKYDLGLFFSGKFFHYRVDISSTQETVFVTRPHVSVSFFKQW